MTGSGASQSGGFFMRKPTTTAVAFAAMAATQPALAAPGDPVALGQGLSLDPIIESRLRYEHVDTPILDADAMTIRLRAGAEVRHRSGLALLAEAEGTLALDEHYNAFPFAIADSQRRVSRAVVADPMNVELNRLQLRYAAKTLAFTIGRQRINLDDQRFVGSVGWRQNEQTFDAFRAEAKLGPANIDATYAVSQRTIFGVEGGPRRAYDGAFLFLGAGTMLGPLQAKGFAYLLDYDLKEQTGPLALANADTQTYGLRVTGAFPVAPATKLNVAASYARQTDWKENPADFSAEYVAAEAGLALGRFGATAGYEKLGGNGSRSFQTPMATLHKFNGWADLFLVTPPAGLQDFYGGASYSFKQVKALPGLNAAVAYHRFESDAGSAHFGDEWDASVGCKLGRMNLLAKFADYDAARFGSDTRKFWLQVELAY